MAGPEQSVLGNADLEFHRREYERLRSELETSSQRSRLPEGPSARPALNDLLVKLRLGPTLVAPRPTAGQLGA
jgi:hypothetical protein